jgi:hypothetical protein
MAIATALAVGIAVVRRLLSNRRLLPSTDYQSALTGGPGEFPQCGSGRLRSARHPGPRSAIARMSGP